MEHYSQLLALLEQARVAQQGRSPLPVGALILALRRLLALGAPPARHAELLQGLKALQAWLSQHPPAPPPAGLRAENLWTLGDLVERAIRALGFAQRLAELQARQGLSVPDLAERAGVDRSLVYKLLKGAHAPPSPETVRRLAPVLGVSPQELLPPGTPTRRSPLAALSLTQAVAYTIASADHRRLTEAVLEGWQRALAGFVVLSRDRPGVELMEKLVEVLDDDPPERRARRLRLISLVVDANEEWLRALEQAAFITGPVGPPDNPA